MFSIPQQVNHVLVAVLNWGLGHASRSSVIIQYLLEKKVKVTIASDNAALTFLQKEFPQLDTIALPAYDIHYSGRGFIQTMLSNTGNIAQAIKKEKQTVDQLVDTSNFDMIISDCRFGVYSQKIPSVLVTHQLKLMTPYKLVDITVNAFYKSLLSQFQELWVPDNADHELSGALSEFETKVPQTFIGPLSSLKKKNTSTKKGVSIILSGPEPARQMFEKKLATALKDIDNVILIRGTKSKQDTNFNSSWTIKNIVNRLEMNTILNEAKVIISRSGYSSIMDYYSLGVSAILIPTPHQTEQEYLAKRHNGSKGFVSLQENELEKLSEIVLEKLSTD